MGLVNMYPWSDFHDVNLDYILKLVRETQGLHLEAAGNNLLMKSADGTVVSSIVVSFAQRADLAALATRANVADSATSAINANFALAAGSAATADSATNAAHAANADVANVATLANSAATAENANHAATADSATNAANAQRAVYAETTGSVEHATNAIETITINGNAVRFTTYGGQNIDITIPYAVKALKDVSNNEFTKAYICNVVENAETGALDFKNMEGNTVVSLVPSSTQAATDNYGNNIADYIKAILVNAGSQYVTINHGNGTSETITIPYSETAWKDSNGNIIKNSYVKRLEVVVDPNDGKRKLVAYNGDNPEAEIFRIELNCYSAQVADLATRAINADHAGSADEATRAIIANSADDNYYVIKVQPESLSNPDELVLVSITDKAGNEVAIEDIDMRLMLNSYIEVFHSNYTPSWSTYYKVTEINNPGGNYPTSPIFFYAVGDVRTGISTSDMGREYNIVTLERISFGILNYQSIGGNYDEDLIVETPVLKMLISEGTTDINSLAVNGSDSYSIDVLFVNIEEDLRTGKEVYDIHIEAANVINTAHLNYNNGDVEFFIWDKANNVNKRFVITAGADDDIITITRTF